MATLSALYNSSIGKKFVMGLTGLFLCSFLVVHLSGNFLLFKNDGGLAFDHYSEFMSTNIAIRTMEIVLALGLFGHILTGVLTWLKNKQSRPQQYVKNAPGENSTLFSRTMFLTGSIVFIFLVIHLKTFWVASRFHPDENPSMYELVRVAFASPTYSFFYIVAIVLLAFHLRHGFQSAFQTFGIKHQKYAPAIYAIGAIFWLLIPLGFISMPVYFLMNS